jgi:hypothetical protein
LSWRAWLVSGGGPGHLLRQTDESREWWSVRRKMVIERDVIEMDDGSFSTMTLVKLDRAFGSWVVCGFVFGSAFDW